VSTLASLLTLHAAKESVMLAAADALRLSSSAAVAPWTSGFA
jgi:hypothetical protein